MLIPWEVVVRNDLVAEFQCTCPSERWIGTDIEHLMKKTHKLWGYADSNFFNNVNAQPRHFECKCGKHYTQQWFMNGKVEILEIPAP